MKSPEVREKYPSSSKNHGVSLHREPWENNLELFTVPQKIFCEKPILVTDVHGVPGYLPIPVNFGMSIEAARALVERSKDEKETHVRDFVPGDEKIFMNEEACERWLTEKNRFPFLALAEKAYRGGARPVSARTSELAAFLWFTEEEPSFSISKEEDQIPSHRMSFRVYEKFTGQGIAYALGAELLRLHSAVFHKNPVWLSVREDNTHARSVYHELCFEKEEEGTFIGADGNKRLVLVHNLDNFQKTMNALL